MEYERVSQSQKDTYKVSVIVPVYNVEDYLEETLTSLENQTLSDIEILLIDDGSTDQSDTIIASFLAKNEDIVYIKQKNKGPGQARNVGIEHARGAYISFLDSDDLLPPNALETLYQAAVREEADLITGASLSFNSKKTWYIPSHLNNGVYKEGPKKLFYNPELLYSLGPCNKLYKTSLIRDIRFLTTIKVTEDHPFVIEAYLKASKIYTVNQVIYHYRRRETTDNPSLSQGIQTDSLSVLLDILKSLEASNGLWDRYLSNRYVREELKAFYYTRILKADIWPIVNKGIVSKEAALQTKMFHILNQWINGFTDDFFNQLPALHDILTYEIVRRFSLLRRSARDFYLETVSTCIKKMTPLTLQRLEESGYKVEIQAVKQAVLKRRVLPLIVYVYRSRINKVIQMSHKVLHSGVLRRGLYPLYRQYPIKRKILFASNKMTRLSDSYENLFKEIKEKRPNYMVKTYFKKNRSFKELCQFYFDVATAKYIILDDYYRPFYNLPFRKQTEIIQMWHAAGAFKKFGFSSIGAIDSNPVEFEKQAHGFYTKVVTTSREVVPKYAEAFHISEEKVFPLGLPRTDFFFDQEKLDFVKEKYLGKYPQLRNKKVVTYAPTFRGDPSERKVFKLQLDLKKIVPEIGRDSILILKLHPSVTQNLHIPNEFKEFVLDLSREEMNPVLAITDLLITDYSSLVFEYALLDRPMIFFAYDLESYIGERGFYYAYERFVPGPIARTTEEVIKYMKEGSMDRQRLAAFKSTFFDDLDGRSAERFVDHLIEP